MSNLQLLGVHDRGVPGSERIQIRVNANGALTGFWLGLGIKQADGKIFPINDNQFWFGNGYVITGDWINVYTGKGSPSSVELPNTNNKVFSTYWNRANVLFQLPEIFPYLIEANNVYYSEDMRSLPSA